MIQTAVTQHFGIAYPIICAPMFLVSNVAMVVAAGEAGGIGTFPALNFRPIEKYAEAIREIKRKTTSPFGINIIVQKSNKVQEQQLDIALEEKVALIITSLGNPKELIKRAHRVGTKVYCDVIGMEHARKVTDLGADGLIAVGYGAGGHAGTLSPFALIPSLVAGTKLPVIASGSIVDGKGMAAAFALGASAVYAGTRFIASKEARVDDAYKKAIIKASPEDIVNTDRVDGFPGNFILTESLVKLGLEPGLLEAIAMQNKKLKRWLSLARAGRALFGSDKKQASYKTIYSAGHGVGMIHDIKPIKAIIKDMVQEYYSIKQGLP